ncbi:metal ABC transporter substrate-binding protein [Meiothermus taiwanensis]|jgi:zinc transport system substrate-binding protein|uniref:Manganese-binding lipoprotein MntA n=2 Tax=Meiothermus taiwanensis TaxID=172827 RepID=A0A399DQ42_9DEIN|nr:metal ABC transporter substrate-binding protein [Meiothermus taiwanensis]AWR86741.1 periplasmic solute binding protein [Meiothermus taiwanensis WR-220]KIQ55325.1 ABC transporter substrate-binding protein [Meiothermus taiwanensis]KZK15073.1 ABC transporter substrate-binding protein [Meiothermus taiwanensis]RIH74375.1 Manganese-binding lipoprotein MntA [Meiothermus taiwanensis]
MRSIFWTGFMLVLGLGMAQANTLSVSATTGFLADMVRNVGGSRVSVVQVVPDGSDPHSFEPRPSVVRAIAGSKVLFANGLFLEPFLEKLEAQLPTGARVIKLAEGMPNLIAVAENEPHQEAGHAHEHGAYDPHLWLDPTYGIRYVERIRDALVTLDPAGRALYTQNAARYIQRIRQVDAEVERCLAAIPQARRKLVSQHESLSYFNRYYRLKSLGSIADFVGQERGPASLARLAQAMKKEGVRVIFVEPQFSQSQARSLAEATGARVVRIYSDAFDSTVNSYLKLIQANGQAICTAFK